MSASLWSKMASSVAMRRIRRGGDVSPESSEDFASRWIRDGMSIASLRRRAGTNGSASDSSVMMVFHNDASVLVPVVSSLWMTSGVIVEQFVAVMEDDIGAEREEDGAA